MSVPNKICDYCSAKGIMPTFSDGETICYSCLDIFPIGAHEARIEIVQLRTEREIYKNALIEILSNENNVNYTQSDVEYELDGCFDTAKNALENDKCRK